MRTSARGGRLFALVAGQQLNDLLAHPVKIAAKLDEFLRRDAFALADQTEQDVLGPDVVVVEQARFFLRQHDNSPSPVGKPLELRDLPPGVGELWGTRA